MANDVDITPGSGATVATDETGGKHYQIIKLASGTEDATDRIGGDATNGLDVDVTRVIPGTTATALGKAEDAAHSSGDTGVMVLGVRNDAGGALAGTTGDYIPFSMDANGYLRVNVVTGALTLEGTGHVGQVGGHTPGIRPTITLSTSPAYSIGDIMGGEIALTNAMRLTNGTGVLGSIAITDKTNTKPELDLLFFESNPAGTYTDNAAFPSSSPDAAIRLGSVKIATTDWVTFGDGAMATKPINGLGLYANASQTPYLVIVTRTAYTAAATSSMTAYIAIMQD